MERNNLPRVAINTLLLSIPFSYLLRLSATIRAKRDNPKILKTMACERNKKIKINIKTIVFFHVKQFLLLNQNPIPIKKKIAAILKE